MKPSVEAQLQVTRRYFLGECTGVGIGALALGSLLRRATAAAPEPGGLHFAPRAERVIFLTQSGGPSQIELYDHKPGLARWAGTELPASVRMGQRLTSMTANQQQLIM